MCSITGWASEKWLTLIRVPPTERMFAKWTLEKLCIVIVCLWTVDFILELSGPCHWYGLRMQRFTTSRFRNLFTWITIQILLINESQLTWIRYSQSCYIRLRLFVPTSEIKINKRSPREINKNKRNISSSGVSYCEVIIVNHIALWVKMQHLLYGLNAFWTPGS